MSNEDRFRKALQKIALEEVAELRKGLDRALGAWERYLEEHHKRDPYWPHYEKIRSEIEDLKKLVRP